MPKQLRQFRWMTRSVRRGFTLIELMIVIAIIATLMGLSFAVFFGLTDQAEEEATNTTIQKVNRLLEQRIEAFDRAFRGSRQQQYVVGTKAFLADPDQDGNFNDRIAGVRDYVIDILAKKAGFRFEFPQRFVERTASGDTATLIPPVIGPPGFPGMPDSIARASALLAARTELIADGFANPTNAEILSRATARWRGGADGGKTFSGHRSDTESSELLYYMLITSGSFGSSSVDADRFTADEVRDTDGDGLLEFVDAWGQPLRFYRWPTRLVDPTAPSPYTPDFADLNDPTDVLINDGSVTVGSRYIDSNLRNVAGLLMKGLPPAPSVLPSAGLPRDLLLTDPDDPVGRLYAELERLNGTTGNAFSLEFNELKYHTPDTFHAPLLVSAGPDGVLGLREPNENDPTSGVFGNLAQYADTTTFSPFPSSNVIDSLTDNLTNRNRRAGGRK